VRTITHIVLGFDPSYPKMQTNYILSVAPLFPSASERILPSILWSFVFVYHCAIYIVADGGVEKVLEANIRNAATSRSLLSGYHV
jgi:hypothetical protein